MPQDRTAVELRRRAAQIRQEADAAARRLEDAADLLEQMPTVAESKAVSDSWALPSEADNDTLVAMDTSTELGRSPRGRKFKAEHPLVERAKRLKKPMHAVATELEKHFKRRFPRTTVRSWYLDPDNGDARPIPKDVAEYFSRKPWSIPLRAWSSISDG